MEVIAFVYLLEHSTHRSFLRGFHKISFNRKKFMFLFWWLLFCWLSFQPWILVEKLILRLGFHSLCLSFSSSHYTQRAFPSPSGGFVIAFTLHLAPWAPESFRDPAHSNIEDNTDAGTNPGNGLLKVDLVPRLYLGPPSPVSPLSCSPRQE